MARDSRTTWLHGILPALAAVLVLGLLSQQSIALPASAASFTGHGSPRRGAAPKPSQTATLASPTPAASSATQQAAVVTSAGNNPASGGRTPTPKRTTPAP